MADWFSVALSDIASQLPELAHSVFHFLAGIPVEVKCLKLVFWVVWPVIRWRKGRLTEPRNIRGDCFAPLFKARAESIPEQSIFDMNTDLDAREECRETNRPPRQPSQ